LPENRRKYNNKSLNLFFRFFGFFFLIIYYHTFFSKPEFKKKKRKKGNNSNNYNCFVFCFSVCLRDDDWRLSQWFCFSFSLSCGYLFVFKFDLLIEFKKKISLGCWPMSEHIFVCCLAALKVYDYGLPFEYFNYCVTTVHSSHVFVVPPTERITKGKKNFFFKSQQLRCESL
jgi:hypothetical protein